QRRKRPVPSCPALPGSYSYLSRLGARSAPFGEANMNAIRLLAVGAVVCLLAAGVRADDKKDKPETKADNAKLIVGKWKITKGNENGPAEGNEVEFGKDGKLTISGERDGNKFKLEGEYKVEGDKFTITRTQNGQENKQEITIKKLDDNKLIVANKDGNESELT